MKLWWMALNQVTTLNTAQTKPKQSKGLTKQKQSHSTQMEDLDFVVTSAREKKNPGGYRYSFQKEKTTVKIRYHY